LAGDIDFHRRWRRERVDTHVKNSLPAYDEWQQRVYHLPPADTFRTTEHQDVATDPTDDRVDAASIFAGAVAGALAAAGMIRARIRREERDVRD
jgi:hypothetical protein